MIPEGQPQKLRDQQLLDVYNYVLGDLSGAKGGTALGAAEFGINVQNWYGWLHDGWFYLRPEAGTWMQICATPDAVSATFAFDRNMDPVVCWNTRNDGAFIRYYDSSTSSYIVLAMPYARTAMLCHDDTRDAQSSMSDVIVAYVSNGNLCYRTQRDRYTAETIYQTGVPARLRSFGMSTENRLLWILG